MNKNNIIQDLKTIVDVSRLPDFILGDFESFFDCGKVNNLDFNDLRRIFDSGENLTVCKSLENVFDVECVTGLIATNGKLLHDEGKTKEDYIEWMRSVDDIDNSGITVFISTPASHVILDAEWYIVISS